MEAMIGFIVTFIILIPIVFYFETTYHKHIWCIECRTVSEVRFKKGKRPDITGKTCSHCYSSRVKLI